MRLYPTFGKTLESLGVSPSNDPLSNLINLNIALEDPDNIGIPIIGGNATYPIARKYPDPNVQNDKVPLNERAIVLHSFNHVICMPGCKMIRDKTFDSSYIGVVTGGEPGSGALENVRWIGGEFIGLTDTGALPSDGYTGNYPPGVVFSVAGNNMVFEDITIDGYGAAGEGEANAGPAMGLWGNRIRVINPRILHPFIGTADVAGNGGGIRVYGGTNFRCRGGEVHTGGDAAIQFSSGRFKGVDDEGDISDGAYVGTRCFSQDGRLILVAPPQETIRHVRFDDITGTTTGSGSCIVVSDNGAMGKTTEGVVLRNVTVQRAAGADVATAIGIRAERVAEEAQERRISDVRLENVTVEGASEQALQVIAIFPVAEEPELGAIRNVSWIGGGITGATATGEALVAILRLTNGLFEGLRIAGKPMRPAIRVGQDDVAIPTRQRVRTIAFVDVVVDGIGGGLPGARLDRVEGGAWVRGAIGGDSTATAFRLDANALRCTLKGVNLAGVAAAFDLHPQAGVRIGENHPGAVPDNGRRTALQLGVTDLTVVAGGIGSRETGVTLAYDATVPPPPLANITGPVAGVLIVARGRGATPVEVTETGNLRLSAAATSLDADNTLTLVRLPGGWAEMSRSVN